jgi:1,4-alpha-glucan branching enzyme
METHNGKYMSYKDLSRNLVKYVKRMGFTHIELLPIIEHPFDGSWGYQDTGYFAPTSRYGTPDEFKYFIDVCHKNNIGVILDWVPSHFATDGHGLIAFDGEAIYEHPDPQKGYHPQWKSNIFNYDSDFVKSFLISSALWWVEEYKIDGIRVDAVASMLYLDYSRKEGEWLPNNYGGRENLEAIEFIQILNKKIFEGFPGVMTIAEESTAWPGVTRPVHLGGLGFLFKWNMGWMHDMLTFVSKDPVHRRYNMDKLTFALLYAFHENFILPLSHDEVVHGKASLLAKMPGDDWQKFANLRLLLGYMYAEPGKKTLFMGGEFGQWSEWNHDQALEWDLLQYKPHQGLQKFVKDLNMLYMDEPALYELDFDPNGFQWIDFQDADSTIISFIRKGNLPDDLILFVFNFTPVPRINYRIGAPLAGFYREIINSDSSYYGGSNTGMAGGVTAEPIPCHGRPYSINLNLPPLGMIALKPSIT